MRKGILSLSPFGKTRRKPDNIRRAEEAAAKREEEPRQTQPENPEEKPFVQTILVPKNKEACKQARYKGRKYIPRKGADKPEN